MAIHVAAFFEALTATSGDVLDLDIVPDGVLPVAGSGGKSFYIDAGTHIVGAYGVVQANMEKLRLNSPTFLSVTPPFIRPVEGAFPTPDNPNFQDLTTNPLSFRSPDTLGARLEATGTLTADESTTVVWLSNGYTAPPAGPRYAWRYTSSTTATAAAWSSLDVTFENTLPEGRYAIVGTEHISATAIANRLIIPGQTWRPGSLSQGSSTTRTARVFYEERLGVLGTFASFAPPVPQVLCTAGDSAHEGYIHVVRIGD